VRLVLLVLVVPLAAPRLVLALALAPRALHLDYSGQRREAGRLLENLPDPAALPRVCL